MSRTKTITLTLGSLAAGAVIASGLTGVALAADSGLSASPSTSSSVAHSPGDGDRGQGGHRGPGGHGGLGAPGSEPLHGEAVVKAADGTISTVQMIRGSVTAVSATSITVKAEDGYTATFVIDASTEVRTGLPDRTQPHDASTDASGSITDVAVGDVARVQGSSTGTTTTAVHVHAMTAAQAAQLEADRAAHQQADATQSS